MDVKVCYQAYTYCFRNTNWLSHKRWDSQFWKKL